MAITAFCTTCQRTVYFEEEVTPICPVCSSPLLGTVPGPEDTGDANESSEDQTGGA